MDVPEQAMRRALDKPTRRERLITRDKTCRACKRTFASTPKYLEHIACHVLIADNPGTEWATAVAAWREHGWSLVGTDDATGERRMVLPDGEPGE